MEYSKKIPSVKISNYVFRNKDGFHFEEMNEAWLSSEKSFSNGAAMGDLDNDGDLDIVVNNINDNAFLLKNNRSHKSDNHYLRIKLKGSVKNVDGFGSEVQLTTADGVQFQIMNPFRGYLSSMEPILHFGLGKQKTVTKVEVMWPDGTRTVQENLSANQLVTLDKNQMTKVNPSPENPPEPLFVDFTGRFPLKYQHQENRFDDYKDQVLLPHRMSQYGPNISVGDVNGDGYDDFFVCSPVGQSSMLYLQVGDMIFQPAASQPWSSFAGNEDMDALLFDADQDGDLDIYVVSGGYEFPSGSTELEDKLYINEGGAIFKLSVGLIPSLKTCTSTASAGDYDGDGDLDLFVGGRMIPNKYPMADQSYILRNDGTKFTDVSPKEFSDLGIISSAFWMDNNKDKKAELFVAGEWMSISAYEVSDNQVRDISNEIGFADHSGWWFKMISEDIDNDGDLDIIAGNLGTNYKYRVKDGKPFEVYSSDFDDNGTYDIVLGYHQSDQLFPVRGLQCSSEQMPFVKKEFPTYVEFASSSLYDIYGDRLETALHLKVNSFESVWFENEGGKFIKHSLPNLAQISPVFGILVEDFTGNGHKDILLAGNLYTAEVETGNADAGYGLLLEGNADKSFEPKNFTETGFFAPFDARDLDAVKSPSGKNLALVANNNREMQIFGFQKK